MTGIYILLRNQVLFDMIPNIQQIYLTAYNGDYPDFDPSNGNTDVIVVFDSGEKYLARFFTYSNISTLRQTHQTSGDFLSGKYFHAPPMLLVDNCSPTNIQTITTHLLESGDFFEIFKQL